MLTWEIALKTLSRDVLELCTEAMRIRAQAHEPYSRFQVGAALLAKLGLRRYSFVGTNVEHAIVNAVHAEQLAMGKMVNKLGSTPPPTVETVVIALSAPEGEPSFPCGPCCETLAEFGTPQTAVYGVRLSRDNGHPLIVESTSLSVLIPGAFERRRILATAALL